MVIDKKQSQNQKGAASIFIVIFFALLISVITVSFVNIVNQDRQQALNNDLSQSAYDSALSGIEDGKRVIKACMNNSDCSSSPAAKDIKGQCSDVVNGASQLGIPSISKVGSHDSEARIGSEALNQSYTCAAINMEPEAYSRYLDSEKSDIIPLRGKSGTPAQTTIKWFTKKDAGEGANDTISLPLNLPNESALELTKVANNIYPLAKNANLWRSSAKTVPPMLRLQFIKIGDNKTLEDINEDNKIIFLYPNPKTGAETFIALDNAGEGTDVAKRVPLVTCKDKLSAATEGYACSAKIGGLDTDADYYLIITPIYGGTSFQVSLNGDKFKEVIATVDVTGRAGDLFRRVKADVKLENPNVSVDGFNLPGFDSGQSICKDFSIGSREDHWVDNNECPLQGKDEAED